MIGLTNTGGGGGAPDTTKVDIDQGIINKDKVMTVDNTGMVAPTPVTNINLNVPVILEKTDAGGINIHYIVNGDGVKY